VAVPRRRSASRRKATIFAVLAFVLACPASGCRNGRPPMHPESLPGSWVVVGADETLDDIARHAGVPAEDILELNGLQSAAQVQPGKLLFVLTAGAPAADLPAEAASGPVAAENGARPTLRWPLTTIRVVIGSPFGTRWGKAHQGIDLPAPIGTPVFAAADGRVVYAGSGIRGYGNLVVLKHPGDLLTVYAHNSVLLVSEGQAVHVGDRIALVGQSGHATGPHLHFEVRTGQIPRDPMSYLPPGTGS
jgi:murein DD-endopeptidase MepM/ murein hydrolase activator NlpD